MINQDLQRAVGQTAQVEPWEIISGYDFGCIFYANRKCNLDGDFCPEGPGCPYECHPSDSDRIRELMQAEKDGRCVGLPNGHCGGKDGEKALKHVMHVVGITNNAINRYIADAVAEKLVREEAEKASEENRCKDDPMNF